MPNSVSFASAINYTVGTFPRFVRFGDFNGDGFSDLVSTNLISNNISVLLGNGDGTFGVTTNFAVGNSPYSLAIGDFNGDGFSDLVTANTDINDRNVSVLLGNGNGSFGTATNYVVGSIPPGPIPYSVAVGDFNGDGFADLVTANNQQNNISVLLGNGDGSFGTPTIFSGGNSSVSLAIGDFNGDGFSDLVTANQSSDNISVLLGNGNGSFGAATNFVAGDLPSSVAIGDFNGDGFSDLVTSNRNSDNISVLLGNGDGTFAAATNLAVGDAPSSVAIRDLDGDGKIDLVVTNGNSDDISVLLGNGDGSFGVATNFAAGDAPSSVAIGDFDGDGRADLAVSNLLSNNISVLLNTTPPTVSITAQTPTANEGGSNGVYRLTRTDIAGNLTINLTLDGSSTASTADYTLSGGSVTVSGSTLTATIAAGQSFVDINLAAIDDIAAEAAETLKLNLATGTGYTVDGTNNTATVTIAANDTVVTNTNDSGEGSLRQAILNANANPDANTITFAGSVFTDSTPDTITLTSGELEITNALTINGLGANNLSISGNNAFAVFNVNDGSNNEIAVAINGLTIKDASDLAGIFNVENLTINNSSISGNTALIGSIYNLGTATITNSTISGNSGGYAGITNGGAATITNSTISGNSGFGGGIFNAGTATITNSTISGNAGTDFSGGIYNQATLSIINSTITNNTADSDNNGSGDGGGVGNDGGTVTAQNTIIAGNFDSGNEAPDIFGAVTGNANNLIGSLTGASGSIGTGSDITFASAGITNINQVIGSLANNGGATQTHAIISGSAAINAGDNTLIPAGVTTDQRGITRTIGGTVDIGAYESPFIAPVAANDTATTDENTAVNINVLGNDTDANGDSLSVIKVNGNSVTVGTPITLASGALLTLNANGTFNYNPNSQFESLGVGATASDSFTYTASDNGKGGTSTATVNLTINGVNDVATITGTATKSVTEDTATPNLTATGSLTVSDADAGQNIFNTTVTSATGNLGSLSITNAGAYSYSVANSAVQFLGAGQTKAETFTVKSVDGTATQNIVVTINGVNDVATITGTATKSVTEDTATPNLTATGSLTVSDADAGQNIFNTTVTSATGNLGSLSITNAGAYSYSVANSAVQFLGAGQTKAETFTVKSVDGTASQNITVTINGVNDAPTVANALPDKTTIENSGFNFTVPANTFADVDTSNTLTYTATLDNGNALPSWLTFNATTRIFSGTPVAANVGTIGVKVTAKDNSNATVSDIFNLTVTPLNLTGTPNADTLTGTASNNTINGLAGNDTITGNKGNDTITGGTGQDRFVYNLGDGVDTITDFGGVGQGVNPSAAVIAATDTLKFQGAGLTAQNLLLTKNGSNLEVSFESVVNSPKVILQNFALENLDNLRKVNGASVDLGNILFNGQTTIQNDFDVFDANSTLTSVSRENIVTFLNDNNNTVDGFNNSNDVINAQGGNDRIDGKSGNDLLRGGAGNDILIGGSGNDILIGGADNDTLTGGSGNDQFVYQAFSDKGTTGDTITDFNKNDDKLVLTDLFKSLSYSGTNAIADGYLRFVQSGTSTRVQVDANGGADAFSTLTTLNNFTATNLVIGSNVFV
ncbi:beta strand repeat-containing protein [Nostoc sp. 'Peltigera membranacea cyanobiont' N6]|uniref:beta strand repeat-containing protein n=1 Tax=Nostoc sp. 'Peltigera membranacea cyanobiont' N6 TaxID=1261031 RepID=UPI000CF3377C|nr:FG-GAP-like repeat-containing protein [Nostoc sp. 'Peltigera membranacea cyanobiont' N6]AVH67137.1 VCBS repeat-containing protein [Nostoc sp. 'Peltigera membranacea cyanobiont' N6]